MFSKAIAEAKEYTRPVVILYRMNDGRVESNVGTFIHLDDIGHILSASHIFKMGSEDPISNVLVTFDGSYFNADYISDDPPNDLVLLKLRNFNRGSIKVFPKFLNGTTGELPHGTPLVRLGFPNSHPHSHISASWDESNKSFRMDKIPRTDCFHNFGWVTRYVDRKNDVRLIEVSSPALIGQSGGPVLTVDGTVVGLQSRNSVFEFPGKAPIETGLASTHIAVARFLKNFQHAPT